MSFNLNIRTTFRELLPVWLKQPGGLMYTFLLYEDLLAERVFQGVQARFPDTAPEDALTSLGRDRRITRGITEGSASYRARLKAWLTTWRKAGHAYSILEQLHALVDGHDVPMKIVTNSGLWYLKDTAGNLSYVDNSSSSGGGGNWDWDSNTGDWSRFWVIIYPPATLWTRQRFGGGWKFGDADSSLGSNAKHSEVLAVREIIRRFKPAHTECVNIIVSFDASLFDETQSLPHASLPDGTWQRYGKNTDPVTVNRDDGAIYWTMTE